MYIMDIVARTHVGSADVGFLPSSLRMTIYRCSITFQSSSQTSRSDCAFICTHRFGGRAAPRLTRQVTSDSLERVVWEQRTIFLEVMHSASIPLAGEMELLALNSFFLECTLRPSVCHPNQQHPSPPHPLYGQEASFYQRQSVSLYYQRRAHSSSYFLEHWSCQTICG
jgi:hypothetical protein